MVWFFWSAKIKTIYIYHVKSGHNVFFSQSHVRHLQHFHNPFIKQIYSLKFFQRPGAILGQIGIPHTDDIRVHATCYFTVLDAVVLIQISIHIFFAINRLC